MMTFVIPRRRFLKLAAAAVGATRALAAPGGKKTMQRMPVVFVGHGSPMNAIEDNDWSRAFRKLGASLPKPAAILAVSAHWETHGTRLTAQAKPPTIHDFGGFPKALHELEYPAPGDPALAGRLRDRLAKRQAALSTDWGLDHGTWSVLNHMRPAADTPVVQMSMDEHLTPAQHLELARELAPLRDEGVLIVASGNVTHNLRHSFESRQRGETGAADWAKRFDAEVTRACEQHDESWLARALETEDGKMSHPTADHYLPLLYAVGAASKQGAVTFPITGFAGSLSMRAVVLG
jgi:4,5-DOPA dioxygenase extradiol